MRRLILCLLAVFVTSVTLSAQSVDVAPATASGRVIRELVETARMDELRWPDFSDYRKHLRNFYAPAGYRLFWSRDGRVTQQARSIIALFESADSKGINSVDYDGARWSERLATLAVTPNDTALARFDVALSVALMRYISDLHIGRINPRNIRFELDIESKKYYLPTELTELAAANDPAAQLREVEPPFPDYRRLQTALVTYRRIAAESEKEPPVPAVKALRPGESYSGIAQLARMLRRFGDLTVPFDEARGVYDGALVDAVKRFQSRHNLEPDGVLGAKGFAQLNVPAARRVEQIVLALERWRWMPTGFDAPPIIVNIPEFRLRAWNDQGATALTMRVVVGTAYTNQTPVFDGDMKYVVFRPYWNVPPTIQRSEIAPKLASNPGWLAKNNYEITNDNGLVAGSAVDDEMLRRIKTVQVRIRQKPGPSNALGLIKFMFPNQNNVYLHSTPAQTLFARERRDFSHGCIRVEDPVALASWVLRDQPEWTPEKIRTAMNSGTDNAHVILKRAVPVFIIYATAAAQEDGRVLFFEDIYGHDEVLENALAAGYPYPG